MRIIRASIPIALSFSVLSHAQFLEPIPDKLVVLTFDDSKASHYTVVRPGTRESNSFRFI